MTDVIINEFLNQRRGKPINTSGTDIAWHFNEDGKRRLCNLRWAREEKPEGWELHECMQVWKRAIVSSENSVIMRRLLDLYMRLRADEPL